ncbi:hypothetical protein AMATHDRAFT_10057 [Amanita thiersii Skay4041]|uniref:Retrotransposon gag domain-containing protein n=1 Tax=Amanita thiersii Skay4041 TaxID=703135 RepID=A0A2A9NBK2_9AGAR|nr:hypothetical protein AMATHDRAFT_10057 [Amanita thiersii Skay4041]
MMVGGASGGTDEDPDWSLNQALAQIQQLMNSLAALQNTVHQQKAVIQQLQNQASPPATGSTPRGPKMATPPLYDGSMASFKITWILGFMQSGMAQLFRDHFMVYMNSLEFRTQYLESMEADPVKLLYRDIYKAFRDPNKQATAIQEITTLKQGTKSAEEHI